MSVDKYGREFEVKKVNLLKNATRTQPSEYFLIAYIVLSLVAAIPAVMASKNWFTNTTTMVQPNHGSAAVQAPDLATEK